MAHFRLTIQPLDVDLDQWLLSDACYEIDMCNGAEMKCVLGRVAFSGILATTRLTAAAQQLATLNSVKLQQA
jgi:hypothetical protein